MKIKYIIIIAVVVIILIAGFYLGYPTYKEYKFNNMKESEELMSALPGKWRIPEAELYIELIEFKENGLADIVGTKGEITTVNWRTGKYSSDLHIFFLGDGAYSVMMGLGSIQNDITVFPLNDMWEFQGLWIKIRD